MMQQFKYDTTIKFSYEVIIKKDFVNRFIWRNKRQKHWDNLTSDVPKATVSQGEQS
jgi:hypothetical protein